MTVFSSTRPNPRSLPGYFHHWQARLEEHWDQKRTQREISRLDNDRRRDIGLEPLDRSGGSAEMLRAIAMTAWR